MAEQIGDDTGILSEYNCKQMSFRSTIVRIMRERGCAARRIFCICTKG
jgi:hypothetical protein